MTLPRYIRACAIVVLGLMWLVACRAEPVAEPAAELPTLDVTHWTDRTELFMEHPPFVAGHTALFAVHLTTMGDFKPVADGRARIEFTPESGGQAQSLTGPAPSRPGAFRVEAALPAAGRYRWAVVLEGGATHDRHELGLATVHASEAEAVREAASGPAEDPAAIAYLKEQQWTNAFATARAADGEMRRSVRAPATVHPLPGGEAVVAAPAAGRLVAETLPSIGDRVQAGQILARIEPRLSTGIDRATLDAEVAEMRVVLDGARAEERRAERLLVDRAVPARRVEDAKRATAVAEARLRAAEARLAQRDEALRTGGGAASGNAFALRAPIAGRLADVTATLGAAYDEGAPLFRVVRTDRVELDVQVPVADVASARQADGVAFEIPGVDTPLRFDPHHVHDSGVIDQGTRALSLQMELANPREQLLIGQVGTAVLFARERHRVVVVPKGAVLMEAGRPYVFVQAGGERFLRRFVTIASEEEDRVGLSAGLAAGERVVVTGTYDVQLAAAAKGLPAEGHVH